MKEKRPPTGSLSGFPKWLALQLFPSVRYCWTACIARHPGGWRARGFLPARCPAISRENRPVPRDLPLTFAGRTQVASHRALLQGHLPHPSTLAGILGLISSRRFSVPVSLRRPHVPTAASSNSGGCTRGVRRPVFSDSPVRQ